MMMSCDWLPWANWHSHSLVGLLLNKGITEWQMLVYLNRLQQGTADHDFRFSEILPFDSIVVL